MLSKQVALAAVLTFLTAFVRADDKPAKPIAQDEQYFTWRHAVFVETMGEPLARIRQNFEETPVETRGLKKEMTLAEFVTAIEKMETGKDKISLRLDAAALGNDFAKIAGAKVTGRYLDGKPSLGGLTADALRQVAKEVGSELDYAIRPEGVVITWPRLATYQAVYNLPKLLGSMRQAALEAEHVDPSRMHHAKNDDPAARLVRVLTTTIKMQPWESVEVINGTKLVVKASTERHAEFIDLIGQIRLLAAKSLVMNARLIEVDKDVFDRHVAPLFAQHVKDVEPPGVVLVPEPLFKLLSKQKRLIASDDAKLPRGRESLYLSRQRPFTVAGLPADAASEIEGISFSVDPNFTDDLRYIRLRITRHVDQLKGTKVRTINDPAQGEIEIRTPDVRRSTVSGTVQIPESAAILMRCNFLPMNETTKDKAWLMLARPYIWIESEAGERGVSSVADYSKTMWEGEFPKYADQETGADLPLTDTVKEILQAVLTDVLKNPDLKGVRDFYGTPGSNKLVLDDGGKFAWPKRFKPETPGYELVASKPDPFANRVRVLGIRLSDFPDRPSESEWNERAVEVRVFNAGGSANGVVCGETRLDYSIKRVEKRWVVKLEHVPEP